MDRRKFLENPYRPGAGHPPPFLAGRTAEQDFLRRILRQGFTSENILITGLRGMGKTVLLDSLHKIADQERWLWVGNDLSESSSLSEERLALRLLTDISESFARLQNPPGQRKPATKTSSEEADSSGYAFEALKGHYEQAPGLPSDKLKSVMVRLSQLAREARIAGIVFAYDEAQCLCDRAEHDQYPMSMLVETISAMQRRDGLAPSLLILSGLPQVFNALTQTRTYTERMFHVMRLERLSREQTLAALLTPLKPMMPPLRIAPELVGKVADMTGGYPYLIQFFGKELVEALLANGGLLDPKEFPSSETMERLDSGLFESRWSRTTERQRDLLFLITLLDRRQPDFSASEVIEHASGEHEFTSAQANQTLNALCERGMLYRTRHGRYAFTVPMSEAMIRRRVRRQDDVDRSWEEQRSSALNDFLASDAASPAPPVPPAPNTMPRPNAKRWRWFR